MAQYKGNKTKVKKAHRWWHIPTRKSTVSIPWPICIYCGLVKLRNEATEKAVKAGCDGAEHEDA